jgi:hypothetical protein
MNKKDNLRTIVSELLKADNTESIGIGMRLNKLFRVCPVCDTEFIPTKDEYKHCTFECREREQRIKKELKSR